MSRRLVLVLLVLSLLSAAPAEAVHASLSGRAGCLSRARVDRVRNHLGYAPSLFRACRGWVEKLMERSHLRPNRDTTRAVLAMALAHRFAPYGPAIGATYEQLAFLPHQQCSSYMFLADYIYQAMGGDMTRDRLQGWDGGAVGNHAQLWVDGLMLDPTVGIAAQIGLADLRRGGATEHILDLSHYRVDVGQVPPPATDYEDVVRHAVRSGLYRPEDELFTEPSIDALLDWAAAHPQG